MKEWMAKRKNEILVGLIVFLITSAFSGLYHFAVEVAPTASYSLFEKLRNYLFYLAGHQSYNTFVIQIIISLFLIFSLSAFFTFAYNIRNVQNDINMKKNSEQLKELEQKEKDDPEFKASMEKAGKNLEKVRKKIAKEPKSDPHKRKIRLVIEFILFLLSFCYIIVYEITPSIMRNSFDLAVTQIAPYIEEQQVRLLRSKWATMDSYDDYIEIDNYIKTVKTENDLAP